MSYIASYFHIVFGTYKRKMTISEKSKRELYAYINGIIKSTNSKAVWINGIGNHIHILVNIHQDIALSKLVGTIKSNSSSWLKYNPTFPNFEKWAKEYYAASISTAMVPTVKQYIQNQENHHLSTNFDDEIKYLIEEIGLKLYYNKDGECDM